MIKFEYPGLIGAAMNENQYKKAQTIINRYQEDINETFDNGMSILHFAVLNKDYPAMLFLLKNGANPDNAPFDTFTPFELAVFENIPKYILEAMIDNGVDLYQHETLKKLKKAGRTDVINLLRKKGYEV